jgi:hypothetical protein
MLQTFEHSIVLKKYAELRKQARLERYDAKRVLIARYLAYAIVIIGILDAISTNAGLAVGAVEMNPIIRYIMEHFGEMWIAPKLLVHIWLAFMVLWFPNRPTLIMMMCAMLITVYAVFGNFSIAFG